MEIAIYGKAFSNANTTYIQQLFNKLEEVQAKLLIYKPFLDFLNSKIKFNIPFSAFTKHEEINQKADFLFSIGGDGTLLDTITLIRDSGIPIMGINTGRLGFLSSISKEEIEPAIDEIVKGNFSLDKRTLLRLETSNNVFGDLNYALNEITIHKKAPSSMITIHASMNEEPLNSYWADGLIIATPTGSTAYSLSCGGPVITPDSENFIITPVAPHNFNIRPIVIPDRNIIKLKVGGKRATILAPLNKELHDSASNPFLVSLDSRSETVDSSIELTIRKEDFKINLLRLHDQNFLTTLRNKLMWGLDKRN